MFLGFHFALFFRSVQLTSIAEAALLGTVAPVFTEFYSIMFQKKRFSIKVLGGLFLALLGAYTLLSQAVLVIQARMKRVSCSLFGCDGGGTSCWERC